MRAPSSYFSQAVITHFIRKYILISTIALVKPFKTDFGIEFGKYHETVLILIFFINQKV